MAVRVRMVSEMEGGTVLESWADQRDFAAAEGEGIDRDEKMHTWVRFCAWSSLKRAGLYGASWPEFNAACVEAASLFGEGGEAPDPGRKGPTAES